MRLVHQGAILLLCGTAQQLAAQGAPARDGFWFGADAGYGRLSLPNCLECEPAGVLVGSMRFGGKLGNHALVGLELSRTANGAASGLPALTLAAATAYVYPMPRSGFHVKVGIGPASRGGYSNVDGFATIGFLAGLGFDRRVAPNISVVPFISWLGILGGYETHVVQGGVGVTFH
jgi:hypothetical protein